MGFTQVKGRRRGTNNELINISKNRLNRPPMSNPSKPLLFSLFNIHGRKTRLFYYISHVDGRLLKEFNFGYKRIDLINLLKSSLPTTQLSA
jgi:hypothetical protein